jgi:TonB family protein
MVALMRVVAYLVPALQAARLLTALCCACIVVAARCAQTSKEIKNPQVVASAKTVYFEDKCGVDAVGNRALAELSKWGRFQVVQDRKNADLIVLLTTDPGQGGNLTVSGGQTATIDSQGHVAEDAVPNYTKLGPVREAYLIVTDGHSGAPVWNASQRWGGLLTGFDSVGEHLVKEFETEVYRADQRAQLKVIKSVNPKFPADATTRHLEGSVEVRIVVGKDGRVSSAKAVSGPAELLPASVEAAKQWQFEPPEHPPVTTVLEMGYSLEPKPCPAGRKGTHPYVEYREKLPMSTGHPGELKLLAAVDTPPPRYTDQARGAGVEGDLELMITVAPGGDVVGARVTKSVDPSIDNLAVETVRAWKFKVSRGEQAAFAIKFVFRLNCFSSDEK